ncbi:hypothetical protein [Enterobacter hormaechei]|uniref:hypothetical protein n=1 Tax=Enterobacter hormaechei TaxID=158836 RepID=UPI0029DB8503|nr:hypothetical protein [Enterobacter hormaechei]MDX7384642.1 hypothetical protein [Enterobacter hormaechei]
MTAEAALGTAEAVAQERVLDSRCEKLGPEGIKNSFVIFELFFTISGRFWSFLGDFEEGIQGSFIEGRLLDLKLISMVLFHGLKL